MARATFETWIPESYDSSVIQRINQTSAVERLGRHIPMNSDNKHIARSGGISVSVTPKGTAYNEDTTANDEVLLTARKITTAVRIAEEDIDDSFVDILAVKKNDWATSYGKMFDNATLAVTAAENGTTVPFTSVYRALSQTNAATGYTANANVVKSTTGTPVSYQNLSDVLAKVETGDFFDPADTVVIANPAFLAVLRGVKDANGMPIFQQGSAATPDTLFGLQVAWSLGARTSAVATDKPTGNPILVVANREHLIVGDRTPAESIVIDGRAGTSALTDEVLLKLRTRKGFVVGHEGAFAVLEVIA